MTLHCFRNESDIWLTLNRDGDREIQKLTEAEAEEIVMALQHILKGNMRYDGCI